MVNQRMWGRMPGCWARAPREHHLRRNPARGRIAGVCSGLGDHFGVDPFLIRLGFVAALFMMGPVAVMAYVVAVIAVPPRSAADMAAPPPMPMAGQTAARPTTRDILKEAKERLRDCEARVVRMEAYVASREFELSRAIRNLDKS